MTAEYISSQIINEVSQLGSELTKEQINKISIYVCSKVLSEIPMYVGNLNPRWKLYSDANFKDEGIFKEGHTLLSEHTSDDSFYFSIDASIVSKEPEYKYYKPITLEQFKKHVLKEDVEEEDVEEEDVKLLIEPSINIFSEFLTAQTVRFFSESGIPVYDVLKNHFNLSVEVIQNMISNNEIQLRSFFIHLGSYVDKLKKEKVNKEKEESNEKVVNPTLFGTDTYRKTGRIEVGTPFEDSFESDKEQEEIRKEKVLYPRRLWIEDRINAINQSVKSYLDYDYCIPPEWVEERNELIEQLNNL